MRIRRVYLSLFVFIGLAFALVNAAGLLLKHFYYPSRLSYFVVENFLFPIKAGDVEHAIELLSPDVTVVRGKGGEAIGLRAGEYFCSFRELSRCAIHDEYPKGQMLSNGAFVKVINSRRVTLVPGDTSFPWNEIRYLQKDHLAEVRTVIAYLRMRNQDDESWTFGLVELERLTGRKLLPERLPPPGERTRILAGIERQVERD